MPNIIWNSNKQKNIEFEKATAYFLANKDQNKYRRKDSELQHSFMKFGDSVLAMNAEGNHLAKGSYRVLSAKLAEDQSIQINTIFVINTSGLH
ncbi:hypothetical protein AVI51_14550 [Piscirickettsia salmonis]|uniref:hypothetical protein n=1 Tax=Piscirickettsia salmonis TaxID=1238 RepID=UPI0006BDAD15|nr:hypothetical protein [Piscirickettsia salmonis]ALA24250.1 tyrosine protein kinase [Piscirickettsia salmonis]APS44635.1 hypothetical protein AVI48_09825 [Piscirickettsia salmonis]APS47995.1 hypothetical protein AVI49_10430 [Piscirickettsia salmonis]APS51953.1 hypothetical protein AVI50_14705 [Piscirickettsia salmonis]APS55169.1 hypothetical protein AVI51_14550 [Piscirickettsia salmonis]